MSKKRLFSATLSYKTKKRSRGLKSRLYYDCIKCSENCQNSIFFFVLTHKEKQCKEWIEREKKKCRCSSTTMLQVSLFWLFLQKIYILKHAKRRETWSQNIPKKIAHTFDAIFKKTCIIFCCLLPSNKVIEFVCWILRIYIKKWNGQWP